MKLNHPFIGRVLLGLLVAVVLGACSHKAQQARSLERAKGFFEKGEYEKAKVEYLSIVQKDRNNGQAISQIGLIWALQGSPLQAMPFLTRARELGKLPDDLRPRLVVALAASGRQAEAMEEARGILARDPSNEAAIAWLVESARTEEQLAAVQQILNALPQKDTAVFQAATVSWLLRGGRFLDADAAVKKAVALDPNSAFAHRMNAAVRQADKDLPGLEAALQKSSELAPARSPERLRFAEMKRQQGKRDEARTLIEETLKEAPDFVPAHYLLAQLSQDAKDYDQALAILDKIFAIDSTNPGSRLFQADLLMEKGEAAEAVKVLQRMDRLFEESRQIRLKLAKAHTAAGQLKEAEDLLNKMLTKEPDLTEASLLLADAHLRGGNAAAVVPAMRAVLEKHPSLEPAALYLVMALDAQRRFDEALRILERLADSKPENTLYRTQLAQMLLKAGQGEAAREAYEKVLQTAPSDQGAVSRLIDLDLNGGKKDDALRRAQALLDKDPKSIFAAFTVARVLVFREEWEAAEKALLACLDLEPSHADSLDFLARLYVTTNRVPLALQTLEKRLQFQPKDARALLLQATLLTGTKEYAKSAESYERLLAALPSESPRILNNLAVLYSDHLGKDDRAFELAEKARALRPSVTSASTQEGKLEAATIADTLGWLNFRKGQFPQAYILAQEALSQLAQHPEVQAHFGLVAAAMGKTDEAKSALGKAVAATADFSSKEQARQRLELLTQSGGGGQTTAELAAAAAKSPEDPLLQLRLAEALEKEEKFAEAAAAYAAAFKLNPELADAARQLAVLYAGPLKDAKQAMDFAKKARDLAPNDRVTAGVLGGLALRAGEFEWSYDLLREAVRGGTQSASLLLDLGRAAYASGRVEEARQRVQEALEASPAPEAAEEAKLFLVLTATPAPAESVAAEALAKDELNVPALMVVADAKQMAGDTAAASELWQKVLGLHPDFAPAQKKLALALARDPSTRGKARELIVKARETLADDTDLIEALAILTTHRKDHQYAVELFGDVARVRPPSAEALYYQGVSQIALGEAEVGKASIEKAVAAGLSGPEAEQAAALLQPQPKAE